MQDRREEMNPLVGIRLRHPQELSLHRLDGMLFHRGQNWLTDKTPDDHATASWNSIVKKSRGCFWCWIFEAMAGGGSAFAGRCTAGRRSDPPLGGGFPPFQPVFP